MKKVVFILLNYFIFILSIEANPFQELPPVQDGNYISYYQQFEITSSDKSTILEALKNSLSKSYNVQNTVFLKNTLQTDAMFIVSSNNIFGKTTRHCNYSISVKIKDDSLFAEIDKIYFTWYRKPMHKGDRGGWRKRTFEEVYPPEDKVPLEKKTYRQYINQAEQEFEKIFLTIKSLTE